MVILESLWCYFKNYKLSGRGTQILSPQCSRDNTGVTGVQGHALAFMIYLRKTPSTSLPVISTKKSHRRKEKPNAGIGNKLSHHTGPRLPPKATFLYSPWPLSWPAITLILAEVKVHIQLLTHISVFNLNPTAQLCFRWGWSGWRAGPADHGLFFHKSWLQFPATICNGHLIAPSGVSEDTVSVLTYMK